MALRDILKAGASWLTDPAGKSSPTLGLETKASDAARAAVFTQVGITQYPPREYRQLLTAYRKNPIIRRATKLCAEAVAAIEPVVRVDGKEEKAVAVKIAKMLQIANPKQDRFNFIRDLAAFEKLSGNGYVEAVSGITRDYIEQYALRPERMQITPGPNGWPAKYTFDPGTGHKKDWNAEGRGQVSRLLHIKDFSTDNDHFGSGALEAAEGPLALYEGAQTLARALMENGAVMNGALTWAPKVPAGAASPSMTEEQRGRLQKMLDEWSIGKKKAGKPIIIPESLQWTSISSTLVDLQAEEIRNQAARQIANAFGVPPMLLGIPGDNTYANFQEASRAFYRSTVIPDATRIFGALGRWYGLMSGIEDVTLEVDEEKLWSLADEVAQAWARIDSADGLTFDEKREAKGYDMLNINGVSNVVMVSTMLVPIDQAVLGPPMPAVDYEQEGGAPPKKLPPPK